MSFTVDDRPGSGASLLGDERKPDLRLRFLRLYIAFAVLILAGVLSLALLLNNRLERETRTADLALVSILAKRMGPGVNADQFSDEFESWVEIAGIEGPLTATVIDSSRNVLATYQQEIKWENSREWNIWQRLIFRTALFDESGSFTSMAPDGEEWLHSYATLPEIGHRLIIQRPAQTAFATSQLLTWGLLVAIIIYLAGGVFSWFILSYRVIRPLDYLETYSERIRWRGQLSPSEQTNIDELIQRNDQLGNLARSLEAMQDETEKRLVQLSTLLETSRVVAASLESTEVIDNILDQVQTLFNVARTAVVVLDQRASVFRIRSSRGLSENYARQLRIDPTEPTSPSMRALRKQTPVQVADTETDLSFVNLRQRSRAEGFRSVLAIPLRTQQSPPAVLLLYKSETYRYSFNELELASSFGHHASIALENAALYAKTDERLQEQTLRLEAIVESLNDGLILESLRGEVLFCNQRLLSWLQISRSQARDKSLSELTEILLADATDGDEIRQALVATSDRAQERALDLSLETNNGRMRDLRIHLFNVTDVQGDLLGRGQLWQDVTRDKEVDRMKSALLSTVSHELRTPLATIKGFASTLLAEDVDWDKAAQREFLTSISDETDRLTRLVQNLLDMSRIQAGMLTIHCELFSINDLLPQVVHGFGAALDGRLHMEMSPELPPVWMDVSRIATVIRNLIENAVKYSAPDRKIEIMTRSANGRVLFSVRDYGPGVAEELREKVFERFFRAENGLTRQAGGSGLGLAISKGFVEAHNGRIWVAAADPGAIFTFSLPLDRHCREG
ncbi:MAG: GAF domain-containing protein [Chloroflexi bacterium]|nr:GAF domain-containing protein [Chloroflexota bacterium]